MVTEQRSDVSKVLVALRENDTLDKLLLSLRWKFPRLLKQLVAMSIDELRYLPHPNTDVFKTRWDEELAVLQQLEEGFEIPNHAEIVGAHDDYDRAAQVSTNPAKLVLADIRFHTEVLSGLVACIPDGAQETVVRLNALHLQCAIYTAEHISMNRTYLDAMRKEHLEIASTVIKGRAEDTVQLWLSHYRNSVPLSAQATLIRNYRTLYS